MSKQHFSKPQRQSLIGILLIFFTAVFQLVRNFWVLGVYFLLGDINQRILLLSLLALLLLLVLILIYSILFYLRFRFFIVKEKEEFVLEKGVFSFQEINIPFNKIQQVNFKRNLLQRLLGVYSVSIDTAGSKDKEVEIKALTKAQADSLGETLMMLATKERGNIETESEVDSSEIGKENQILWEHRLSISTLIKLGLTSNYLRGLAILLTFYFSFKEKFEYSGEIIAIPDFQWVELLSTGLLIFVLIIVGMLITVGETFIKYHNLILKRFVNGLQVEMGLRENTRVTLRAERVQLVQVLTNPLQRKLDLYKLKISLASSQEDFKKDRIQIPGLPQAIVEKVMEYLYLNKTKEKQYFLPNRLLLSRGITRGIIPILAGMVAIYLDLFPVTPEVLLIPALLYIFLMVGYQLLYFKSLRLAASKDFLIKYSGVWIKKKQVIEMYKLQAVTLSQPLWYKRRKLVNLSFHTAGGDLRFYFTKSQEAIPLINYLIYKIEATERHWM